MFDPQFDPLERLENLTHDVRQLRQNELQIAQAINQQNDLIKQLTQELSNQSNKIIDLYQQLIKISK
jgi:predicted RNase H-like nuclease (RuvC/YqgF family)